MNQYLLKPRFKTLFSNLFKSCSVEQLMDPYDYFYYIFHRQGSSYETHLRVSTLVEKVGRDDRNVLCSY